MFLGQPPAPNRCCTTVLLLPKQLVELYEDLQYQDHLHIHNNIINTYSKESI